MSHRFLATFFVFALLSFASLKNLALWEEQVCRYSRNVLREPASRFGTWDCDDILESVIRQFDFERFTGADMKRIVKAAKRGQPVDVNDAARTYQRMAVLEGMIELDRARCRFLDKVPAHRMTDDLEMEKVDLEVKLREIDEASMVEASPVFSRLSRKTFRMQKMVK